MANILSQIFGQTPSLPTNQFSQGQAITGNIGELGNLGALTTGTDTISAEGAALPYQLNLPDYTSMLSTATGNASQELEGQLPTDVLTSLQTQSAERGVATGQGAGGPNANASYLQDLGLTSLGLTQQGLGNFENLLGGTPTGQPFNPASMFVSPEEQQQRDSAQAIYNAAPNPVAAGIYGSLKDLEGEAAGMATLF